MSFLHLEGDSLLVLMLQRIWHHGSTDNLRLRMNKKSPCFLDLIILLIVPLRRKMIKLGIPEEEVKFVMQKGVIDLITVIPVEDLNPKGTAFVAAKIYDYCAELYGKGSDEYKESEKRWDDFWADYFMP